MKLMKNALSLLAVLFSFGAFSQCPEVNCPSDTIVSLSPGFCQVLIEYDLPIAIDPCISQDTVTVIFDYTGDMQTFEIPELVSMISYEVAGAEGGISAVDNDIQDTTQFPGLGGLITGQIGVSEGQILNIFVGGKGTNGQDGNAGDGGYNGGGNGNFGTSFSGGGGGGASDIRIDGIELEDRFVVAGGGGGSAVNYFEGGDNGGAGGGLTGENGFTGDVEGEVEEIIVATGGTQTEGGMGAMFEPYSPGEDGSLGQGGVGGIQTSGGGGGGGYYGGGGGSWTGGAGGSSFAMVDMNVEHTQGANEGDGYVIIRYVLDNTFPVELVSGSGSPGIFEVGTHTETYEAIDNEGNTITCSFEITVESAEYPVTVINQFLTSDEEADSYQWIDCSDNSIIPGATDQSFEASELGEYAVILTNDVCVDTTDCYEVATIGVENYLDGKLISVYPNPTNSKVWVDLNHTYSQLTFRLYSSDGREIFNHQVNNSDLIEIDLSDYDRGFYFLQLENGEEIGIIRLIKH